MNEQGIEQTQKQTQTLAVTPQLRMALKILQSPTLELRATISEELQSNPVLEELPQRAPSSSEKNHEDNYSHEGHSSENNDDFDLWSENTQANDSWLASSSSDSSPRANERHQHLLDSLTNEVSLQQDLLQQAQLSDLSPPILEAFEYLVGSLNDKGFLTATMEELAQSVEIPLPDLEKAHLFLKELYPPGIGSIHLQDCLLTQLSFKNQQDTLAFTILRDHFDLLLHRRITDLSQKLKVTPQEIQNAMDAIALLDPAPGSRFIQDNNRVVEPDVIIFKENNNWTVSLNNEYLPRLRLSHTYKNLVARGTLKANEKQYIQSKIQSGKFLINAIEQRQQTLEAIAYQLLAFQKPFFEKGKTSLQPLNMTQLAKAIGVHEATISRAVANKYLSTPHGVFPFKHFFTSGYRTEKGDALANTSIKEEIASLIASENPTRPYSDQKIVDLLKEQNIKIARRTVAKYRESLDILPAHLRREYR